MQCAGEKADPIDATKNGERDGMARRRTVQLGSGAGQLERRKRRRSLIALPFVLAALALMALGAFLSEIVANPSGLALQVPEWITVETVVWIAALVVVGSLLILVQRRYGTIWAFVSLAVLMGLALVALTVREPAAYLTGYGW